MSCKQRLEFNCSCMHSIRCWLSPHTHTHTHTSMLVQAVDIRHTGSARNTCIHVAAYACIRLAAYMATRMMAVQNISSNAQLGLYAHPPRISAAACTEALVLLHALPTIAKAPEPRSCSPVAHTLQFAVVHTPHCFQLLKAVGIGQ